MTECVFARHFGHRAEDRLKETRVDRRNQLVGGGSSMGERRWPFGVWCVDGERGSERF